MMLFHLALLMSVIGYYGVYSWNPKTMPHRPRKSHDMSLDERKGLQDEAKDMFYHGYYNYMAYAFPWDELKPLSCTGRRWDDKRRGDLDDTLGGFALTLIDSLDMLAVVRDQEGFEEAVNLVAKTVSFDRDVAVSVFETTIRVIGGLLSAHMIASPEFVGLIPNYYDVKRPIDTPEASGKGVLLDLAIDVADRLLPAFKTATGLPFHRVNLLKGQLPEEKNETCPAAAGSLLLEMALLSRLSGDSKYEEIAKKAVLELWKRRSKFDLLGSTIHVETGEWIHSHTGIGAGLDSFYEYLLKYHVLFGDDEWLSMFQASYKSIQKHIRRGAWHVEVDMHADTTFLRSRRISALQAFWPGLQVLAGDVTSAIESHRKLFALWKEHGAMPEVYDLASGEMISWAKNYPLRPELAESTYHLYQATKDPYYLHVGRRIMHDLQNQTRVPCGYAAIGDINTKRLEDRMDSFFLSETVKYLYLLFKNESEPLFSTMSAAENTATNSTVADDEEEDNFVDRAPRGSQSYPYFSNACPYCGTFEEYSFLDPFGLYKPLSFFSAPKNSSSKEPFVGASKGRSIYTSNVVFSTEGHVFIISSKLAKSRVYGSKLKKSRPTEPSTLLNFQEKTCQATKKFQDIIKHCELDAHRHHHEIVKKKLEACREYQAAEKNDGSCEQEFLQVGLKISHGRNKLHLRASPAAFGASLAIRPVVGALIAVVLPNTNQLAQICEPLPFNLNNRIILAERGSCTFVTKARNVQAAGGSGVILANTVVDQEQQDRYFVLLDDDTGDDIEIPIVMISLDEMNYLRKKVLRWAKTAAKNQTHKEPYRPAYATLHAI